ncbi:lipase family protein [bacterium]|nr:lipase family protein [bacterium]
MDWFLLKLFPILLIGIGLFVFSFLRPQLVKPNWLMFIAGLVLVAAVVGGVIYQIASPPGGEQTDSIVIDDEPKPILDQTHITRLRSEWDSEKRVPNWPVAETLAVISKATYLSPVEAEVKMLELGFDYCMPVVQGSMIGYVVANEDVTVIAFRGTDFVEISDWLSNVKSSSFATEHGQMHRGFYDAYHAGTDDKYSSMRTQIKKILAERQTEHLWITGHSLGGALSLVCAYDLEMNEDLRIDGMITFGQPVLARKDLAKYLDGSFIHRYARFANGKDLVTKVAPGYSYCGSLVHFTDDGIKRSATKLRLMSSSGNGSTTTIDDENEIEPMTEEAFEELMAQQRAVERPTSPDGRPLMTGAPRMVDDHSMARYLEQIRTLFADQENE